MTNQPNLNHRGGIQNVWIMWAVALVNSALGTFSFPRSRRSKGKKWEGISTLQVSREGKLVMEGQNDLGELSEKFRHPDLLLPSR